MYFKTIQMHRKNKHVKLLYHTTFLIKQLESGTIPTELKMSPCHEEESVRST
ncbi:unnamed protein product, partial [Trichogramma brassicae]